MPFAFVPRFSCCLCSGGLSLILSPTLPALLFVFWRSLSLIISLSLCITLSAKRDSSVPKGVSSVGQLKSDVVIEAVASLLPGVDGAAPVPDVFSTRGLHPAERHRTCKVIASRVRVRECRCSPCAHDSGARVLLLIARRRFASFCVFGCGGSAVCGIALCT